MAIRTRITLLFALLVVGILGLVCASVYYFTYTNRIRDIQTRLVNRAITTGRLLGEGGALDQGLIRKIDGSTSISMKGKVVEAYNESNRRFYQYSDSPADTLRIDPAVLQKARKMKGQIYFSQGDKDAIAFYYADENARFVIVAAAYDEAGNEKLRHLRLVLIFSFVGGILSSVIGGYLFSLRLLHPLRRIADEVNDISARNLTRRIHSGTGERGDEWYYLADTLNQLLNRLQESFEIQGRFIANASHELSTPLTSISSQLEVALQRVRTVEEYRQVIQSVYQDTRQMSSLTQTLLEFARASGTAAGLAIDLLRIDEILLRLPAEISKANAANSVTLDFDRLPEAEEALLVSGNEDLLFTAIRNVVSNACKYSDSHHAIVRLSVGDKMLIIVIEDRGRGIAPENLENIFQPFYRSDDGVSVPGFGLGLSLARRIVQLHKGTIAVSSVVAEGSTFTIVLPIASFTHSGIAGV